MLESGGWRVFFQFNKLTKQSQTLVLRNPFIERLRAKHAHYYNALEKCRVYDILIVAP